jgi:3-hydroxyacyl-[acyl-carrier-protein] dehydratase
MWYSLLDLATPLPGAILAQVVVHDDSPWFSGHFSGNPILPGIAQLYMVAAVIARSRYENLYIKRVQRVKFKKIIRPGEHLEINAVATTTRGLYSFRITSEAQDVCTGSIFLDHQHASTDTP